MIKKLKLLFLVTFIYVPGFSADFITVWDLNKLGNSGGPVNAIFFGMECSGTVNYTWETIPASSTGSGTFDPMDSKLIYNVPKNSIIRLKMDATNINRVVMNGFLCGAKLIDIEQWGTVKWTNMNKAFEDCINLKISAGDVPDLSNVKDMSMMFRNCKLLNGPNNIGSWDVSNVVIFEQIFSYCESFNQPLNNWNLQNANSIAGLFGFAKSFNQPLNKWNINKAVIIHYMFLNASAFNQNIGSWKLDSVIYIDGIFNNSGMDCYNYSKTLSGWSNYSNIPTNLTLGAIGMKYSDSAISDRNYLINSKGWSIIGDTLSNTICLPYLSNNKTSSVTIYPNPTNGNQINIEINNSKNEICSITLINSIGLMSYQNQINISLDKEIYILNTNIFDKGIYFVSIKIGQNQKYSYPIVIN